jgi:2-acylglycerol O-acyltransferase 2
MGDGALQQLNTLATLLLWLGGLHAVTLWALVVLTYLPHPAAVAAGCLFVAAALLPVRQPHARWQARLAAHICRAAHSYFDIRTHVHEETSALFADSSQRCIVGLEPHSVLPLSVIALSVGAPGLPAAVESRARRALASSALFRVPLVKHLWSWLGLASVDRRNMRRLLDTGHCVLLIPGGAAECLHMESGSGVERVLLRRRFGFVKLAMQTGSHLVPAFAFGQSGAYRFWRARSDSRLPRLLSSVFGFAPILFWGRWGTPIPFRSQMRVVVGAPIRVTQTAAPSDEAVAALLATFIDALTQLVEEHKAAAGHPDLQLVVM